MGREIGGEHEGFCGVGTSECEDLDCGGSGRGKNHSGMTKIHARVLGRMPVPTAKDGEGAVLRTSTKD